MRPIRLEIEGLQSFAEKQIIDFETLTEHGLFGIFGKTGSGKSTILDAITLALYGDIVRLENSKEDKLISLLNINSDKIEVKYTFNIGDEEYTIHRIFPKKRNKNELSPQKLTMYYKENIIGDKVSEIKKKIEEIIGLSMEDFTRSVVLPQGKFSDFLKLTGSEKRAMLERIFGLEEYGKKLTNKLTFEKNAKNKEVEALDNQIKGKGEVDSQKLGEKKEYLKKLIIEEKALKNEITEFQKLFKEKEEVKKLLEELEKYKIQEKELTEEKKEIEKLENLIKNNEEAQKIYDLNKDAEEIKREVQKKVKELQDTEKKIKTLTDEISRREETLNLLKEKEKKAFELSQELEVNPEEREKLNNIISLRREIERIGKDQKELHNLIKKSNVNLSEKEILLKSKDEKLNELTLELEKLRSIPTIDVTSILLENGKLESEITEVKKLEKEIEKLKNNLEKEKNEEKVLAQEREKLEVLIETEEAKIKNDLAYNLAKNLKENEDCPVCGSNHHPKLANPSVDTNEKLLKELRKEKEKVDTKYYKLNPNKIEEELKNKIKELDNRDSSKLELKHKEEDLKINKYKEENKIKEEKEKAFEKEINKLSKEKIKLESEINNLKEKIGESQEKVKKLETEIQNKEKELENINSEIKNVFLEELESRYNEIREKEIQSKKYREEAEKYRKEYTEISKKLENNKNKKQELEKDLRELETTIKGIQKNLDELLSQIMELVEKSNFESIEKALSSVISKETIEKYIHKIDSYKKEVIENKALLENTNEKLSGRTLAVNEWEELTQKKAKYEEKEIILTREITSINKDIKNMERVLEEIKTLLEEKRVKEYEYNLLEELYKLFRGNAFVEYLALGKLKNIAFPASKRLEKITAGRYGIEVNENSDFVIKDNFNGGVTRRAATLSGGETFLVSLSLALALSNQIQLKGKSNLEFFFLDEGFGTLDTSLLDKVITSLETLKDDEKLKVGIITHVEELKERVPRKLEVLEPVSGERGTKVELN